MDKQLDYMPLQEKLKPCEVESLLVALLLQILARSEVP